MKKEIINNSGWVLTLTGKIEKVAKEIEEKLKSHADEIYFNDLTGKYWMYDFKIGNVWFSSTDIDIIEKKIVLDVFAL